MNKIKQWLREWLGITELQKTAIRNIGEIHTMKQRLLLFESLVEAGVDVHRYGESWAVVCIKGKADWVQFFDLGMADAEEIRRFLKNFEGANPKVDVYPPNMKKWLFR